YSPRLGLTYLFTPAWSAYVSASKSFRPNSGSDVSGNAFSPETSRAAEIGLKFQSEDQRSGATLAVFDITKQNVLTTDP
ncbi:TonB-dependent receptor, partial [Acinetobacter baumannii]